MDIDEKLDSVDRLYENKAFFLKKGRPISGKTLREDSIEDELDFTGIEIPEDSGQITTGIGQVLFAAPDANFRQDLRQEVSEESKLKKLSQNVAYLSADQIVSIAEKAAESGHYTLAQRLYDILERRGEIDSLSYGKDLY